MITRVRDDDLNAVDAREWTRLTRCGKFEEAWRVSDRIRERCGSHRDDAAPRHLQGVWDGSELAGRRVLIRCYHGLGDTIQFIRYAPAVRAVARKVFVWAQPTLLPLLRTVAGIDRLLPLHDGTPDVEYDVDIEVMELPYAFRTTLSTMPREVPYLAAFPLALAGPRPRVGVVWQSGEWDTRRWIALHELAPLLDETGLCWFSLQLDADIATHPRLHALDTRGVMRLARAIRTMDLVISVDSFSAHLAGALAIPVWTLLPHDADWRWMEKRSDSPWYPTMRLFRQRLPGDWSGVIDEVRQALRESFEPRNTTGQTRQVWLSSPPLPDRKPPSGI